MTHSWGYLCLELIVVAGKIEATMSKPKKSSEQLVEIENLIALLPKAVKDTSGRNLEIRTQERKTN